MEQSSKTSGAHLGGTILACLVAPVILIIVAAIVGGLWALFNVATTVIRPGIIGFFAAIIGGLAGTYSARAACDAVLKSYEPKAVFVELCLLSAGLVVFELSLPFNGDRIAPIAQLITIIVVGWGAFWTGEDFQ